MCVSSLSITKHLHLTKTFAYQQWAETIEKYTQNTYRNYEKLRYMPYLHKYHQEIYIYIILITFLRTSHSWENYEDGTKYEVSNERENMQHKVLCIMIIF